MTTIEIVSYDQKTRQGRAVSEDGEDIMVLGRNFKTAEDEARAKAGKKYKATVIHRVAYSMMFYY